MTKRTTRERAFKLSDDDLLKIAKAVKENELVAYEDLGPEAIRKLYVEDFPLTVINDIYGNDLYDIGKEQYKIVEDK